MNNGGIIQEIPVVWSASRLLAWSPGTSLLGRVLPTDPMDVKVRSGVQTVRSRQSGIGQSLPFRADCDRRAMDVQFHQSGRKRHADLAYHPTPRMSPQTAW